MSQAKFTWISGNDPSVFSPVTQASGILFDEQGRIVLIRGTKYNIPGGHLEPGETAEQAMRREAHEEANITLGKVILIGAVCVDFPGNLDDRGELFYQLRFIGLIAKIDPQVPDPADGKLRGRLFIDPEDVKKYIDWGEPGDRMFAEAVRRYPELLY